MLRRLQLIPAGNTIPTGCRRGGAPSSIPPQMITVADIIDTLSNSHIVWRTLHDVEIPIRGGRPDYTTGNAAVSLRVRHGGRDAMLKCYTRPNANLQAIYGPSFRPRELCVFGLAGHRQWVDCLLGDYVEGQTLDCALCRADAQRNAGRIARAFDEAALRLLRSDRAHGDLKPENMILTPHGTIEFIDWDAAFVPALAGRTAPETGTAAYQHPSRTPEMYDKHIDDYPTALISVMLHAAAADPAVLETYRLLREFPIHPRRMAAGGSDAAERTADLFASRCMAPQYRMARMLLSPSPYLFGLPQVLAAACTAATNDSDDNDDNDGGTAEIDPHSGLWGCRSHDGWRIPPLYDWAFDPTEGTMLVGLGAYSHFIDALDGRRLASLPRGCKAKPLRGGRTVVRDAGGQTHTVELSAICSRGFD